jgi:outer membrane protein assembly factor BamE (lipoprotein component of BamABCDE complex)
MFASGLAGAATVAVDNGIAVKESDVTTPTRGMTMTQVAAKFGAPVTKVPAVGKPPISRWEYPGFVVYFEADHVIHSVVPSAAAPGSEAPASEAPSSAAPSSEAPASQAPASQAPSSAAPSSEAPSGAAPNS